ncbi:MAG: radical SAM protein, partial [Dehalococcoidia bacterium]|nr:radical SAM protein [Dehalococcoidia bacterium]
MKVTFVYPDILYPHIPSWSGTFYTGIGYLAAVLKKAGHEVSLIHITHPVSEQAYVEMLGRGAPDLIAFSATTNMFPYVALWAQWSKQNLGVPTICGGIHPTLNPEETIDNSHIDMLCRGEGEEAIVELCGRLERGTTILDIEGLWVREGNTIHRNKPRRSLRDLDTLPFPDRTVFNHRSLVQSKEGIGIFMASRGCPYDCSYCCNHALRALQGQHGGPAVRFRSVDNVIAEVKTVLAEHPYLR